METPKVELDDLQRLLRLSKQVLELSAHLVNTQERVKELEDRVKTLESKVDDWLDAEDGGRFGQGCS